MGIHPQPHLTDASEDLLAADDAAPRRSFLKKVAIGGAAVAVGSQLAPVRAFAQEDDEESTTTTAAEGGATEETIPLSADEERVVFLAGIALAASGVYRAATGDEAEPAEDAEATSAETTVPLAPITVPPLAEPIVEVLRELGAQHAGQAAAFSALLTEPVTVPNGTLLTEVRSQLGAATDEAAVLGLLRDMDERVAATQLAAIGDLEDVNDTKVAAAALPVVGQQVVVLGQLATPPVELVSLIPVEQTTEGALTEATYPVEAAPGAGQTTTTTTTTTTEADGATDTESEG